MLISYKSHIQQSYMYIYIVLNSINIFIIILCYFRFGLVWITDYILCIWTLVLRHIHISNETWDKNDDVCINFSIFHNLNKLKYFRFANPSEKKLIVTRMYIQKQVKIIKKFRMYTIIHAKLSFLYKILKISKKM